jgi:predicted DNA-binding transcriptional regulator YafY
LKREKKGIVIEINIKRNYELERKILYLGEIIKVLEPKEFSKKIKQRLGRIILNY